MDAAGIDWGEKKAGFASMKVKNRELSFHAFIELVTCKVVRKLRLDAMLCSYRRDAMHQRRPTVP